LTIKGKKAGGVEVEERKNAFFRRSGSGYLVSTREKDSCSRRGFSGTGKKEPELKRKRSGRGATDGHQVLRTGGSKDLLCRCRRKH